MRRVFFLLTMLLCAGLTYLIMPHYTYAATEDPIKIKFTSIQSELYDDPSQEPVMIIPENSPVIVLFEEDGWSEVQYKTFTGSIPTEQLITSKPKHLLINSKNEPLVRMTDSPQSDSLGHLYSNSIVEVYEIDSPQFVFVRYGHLAGYVYNNVFVQQNARQRVVKDPSVIVRSTAGASGVKIGELPAKTEVTVLTNFNGWAFIETDQASGYVLASSLAISEAKPTQPKPPATSKKIALTFDDGPHPKVTPQILKILKKYEAKATFFVVGCEVKKYPQVLKDVANAGHEIGNHTFNHKKLTTLSLRNAKLQIDSTDAVIKAAIGHNATVFRPPYGAYNKSIVNQLNVPNVLWSIDTLDWKHHNPQKTLAAVQKNAKNGSIVLMHDIHQETADALDSILAMLQKQGYEFVTVSELTTK